MLRRASPDEANDRLESRVRENRMHGSEGGAGVSPSRPLSVQVVNLTAGGV
jgi:hypothetical protein